MSELWWRNEIVRLADGAVINWFLCNCPPDSSRHQRMVIGWLLNANTYAYCLRDGLTSETERATPMEKA